MVRANFIEAVLLGYFCFGWDSTRGVQSLSAASFAFRIWAWPLKALRDKEMVISLMWFISSAVACFVAFTVLHFWLNAFWSGLVVLALNAVPIPVPILGQIQGLIYSLPKWATMMGLTFIMVKLFPGMASSGKYPTNHRDMQRQPNAPPPLLHTHSDSESSPHSRA